MVTPTSEGPSGPFLLARHDAMDIVLSEPKVERCLFSGPCETLKFRPEPPRTALRRFRKTNAIHVSDLVRGHCPRSVTAAVPSEISLKRADLRLFATGTALAVLCQ
jgi:hypothetical protein